jgi:hypothetical protein
MRLLSRHAAAGPEPSSHPPSSPRPSSRQPPALEPPAVEPPALEPPALEPPALQPPGARLPAARRPPAAPAASPRGRILGGVAATLYRTNARSGSWGTTVVGSPLDPDGIAGDQPTVNAPVASLRGDDEGDAMCTGLAALRQSVLSHAAGFDAKVLTCAQAEEAVSCCATMEAAICSMKSLAAARAAEGGSWQKKGYRSAFDALALETGMSALGAKRACHRQAAERSARGGQGGAVG